MLERVDNKYIVERAAVHEALGLLQSHFDVLEISGKRSFLYDTCYFDDEALLSFQSHRQGRRRRFKVRTRQYSDNATCFVEMKVKGRRGVTVKLRLPYFADRFQILDQPALQFINDVHRQFYGRPFEREIKPVLHVRFERVTLIAKEGSERVTIDGDIVFSREGGVDTARTGAFIVETKSQRGNGAADKILRQLHQHRVKSCSKYCFGIAALHDVQSYNRFLLGMNKLKIRHGNATRGKA